MVGEAMEQFTMEVIDYMEWDAGSDQFIKTSPPLMEVQVKVLSKVQKNFLGRKAWLWTQLGRSKPTREKGLADTIMAMVLQVDMFAKTRLVVQNIISDFVCH